VFLLLLLAGSLSANVWLSRRTVQAAPPMRVVGRIPGPEPGTELPVLDAVNLDGSSNSYDFRTAGVPTIVFVLRKDCGWCSRNLRNVKAIAAQTKGRFRVVALSLDSAPEARQYVKQRQIDLPMYVQPGDAARVAFKGFQSTPQTVVINTAGRIEKAWTGAFLPPLDEEVSSYFTVKLPGLDTDAAPGRVGDCEGPNGGGFSAGAIAQFKEGFKRCEADGKWEPVTIPGLPAGQ